MIPEPVPCRIYAILARKAPTAVVFRRGPSKWVQLLRWNLEDDTFEPGQWFHGRIYERRGDLSPNGRYLIYFGSKQQNWSQVRYKMLNDAMDFKSASESVMINWTAVSRPPFLTALALWPQDTTYDGGGLFETNRRLLVNHGSPASGQFPQTGQPLPKEIAVSSCLERHGEDFPMLETRMLRDGWRRLAIPITLPPNQYIGDGISQSREPFHYAKASPHGSAFKLIWCLLGFGGTKSGWYRQRYCLRSREEDRVIWLPQETEWADWDYARGRLVWAFDGKLWALPVLTGEDIDLSEAKMLIDLNPNKPEAIVAPDWARRW